MSKIEIITENVWLNNLKPFDSSASDQEILKFQETCINPKHNIFGIGWAIRDDDCKYDNSIKARGLEFTNEGSWGLDNYCLPYKTK